MRRMILTAAAALCCAAPLVADNDRPITFEQLPKAARELITTHFPGEKVALAKIDTDLMSTSYEVVLVGSSKIEFKGDGSWKEIDCEYSKVPEGLIPEKVKAKAAELFAGSHVIEMERSRHGVDVKLSNGMELKFNTKLELVGMDD